MVVEVVPEGVTTGVSVVTLVVDELISCPVVDVTDSVVVTVVVPLAVVVTVCVVVEAGV